MSAGIRHPDATSQPDDPSYDVSANAWNKDHVIDEGTARIFSGLDSAKASVVGAVKGNVYLAIDTGILYVHDGSNWVERARGETVIRLAYLAEKSHASLTNVGEDDHHAKTHTLASHSQKKHSDLTDIGEDDHHAKTHTLASHSQKKHSDLTDIGENDHHTKFTNTEHDTTTRHTLGTVVPHDSLANLTQKKHSDLTDIGANDHHAQSHGDADHSETYEKTSQKGAVSGYCGLDAVQLVALVNIPATLTGKSCPKDRTEGCIIKADGSGDYATIQDALTADEKWIWLADGTYSLTRGVAAACLLAHSANQVIAGSRKVILQPATDTDIPLFSSNGFADCGIYGISVNCAYQRAGQTFLVFSGDRNFLYSTYGYGNIAENFVNVSGANNRFFLVDNVHINTHNIATVNVTSVCYIIAMGNLRESSGGTGSLISYAANAISTVIGNHLAYCWAAVMVNTNGGEVYISDNSYRSTSYSVRTTAGCTTKIYQGLPESRMTKSSASYGLWYDTVTSRPQACVVKSDGTGDYTTVQAALDAGVLAIALADGTHVVKKQSALTYALAFKYDNQKIYGTRSAIIQYSNADGNATNMISFNGKHGCGFYGITIDGGSYQTAGDVILCNGNNEVFCDVETKNVNITGGWYSTIKSSGNDVHIIDCYIACTQTTCNLWISGGVCWITDSTITSSNAYNIHATSGVVYSIGNTNITGGRGYNVEGGTVVRFGDRFSGMTTENRVVFSSGKVLQPSLDVEDLGSTQYYFVTNPNNRDMSFGNCKVTGIRTDSLIEQDCDVPDAVDGGVGHTITKDYGAARIVVAGADGNYGYLTWRLSSLAIASPTNFPFGKTPEFTAWVYIPDLVGSQAVYLTFGLPAGTDPTSSTIKHFGLKFSTVVGANNLYQIVWANGSTHYDSGATTWQLSAGAWHYIRLVYSANNLSVYVDGAIVTSYGMGSNGPSGAMVDLSYGLLGLWASTTTADGALTVDFLKALIRMAI